MADIKIDSRKVMKVLSNVTKGIGDMSPLFKSIGDLELSETRMRLKEGLSPEFDYWPDPISLRKGRGPETAKKNDYKGKANPWAYVIKSNYHATPPGYRFFDASRGDKPLQSSGKLLKSIGRAYGKDYAIVGTNIEYAPELQNGRFPFLGINEQTIESVNEAFEAYFRRISR